MRSEHEIKHAINSINLNDKLTHGYRGDVTYVLQWVLGGDQFAGQTETYQPVELTAELVNSIPGFTDCLYQDKENRAIYWNDGMLSMGGEKACAHGHHFDFPCTHFHKLQQIIRLATGKEIELPKNMNV